jgi:predicted metal-dependent hydrolase
MVAVPNPRPRLVPDEPFPPYSYVPNRLPHPVSDPGGHQCGARPERPDAIDPARWRDSRAYLRGVDLFNFGYYWEAHEVWEGLWHAAGRSGTTAELLKGLIKLAAAGVKVREGSRRGVASHGRKAEAHFRRVAADCGGEGALYLGLRLGDLLQCAGIVRRMADTVQPDGSETVKVVFDFTLSPTPFLTS